MCAAAALGACARAGSEPSRTIAATTAIPLAERLGASLKAFMAIPPPARTVSDFATFLMREGGDRSQDHGFTRVFFSASIAAASRRRAVANAGVRREFVLKSERRLPIGSALRSPPEKRAGACHAGADLIVF